MGALINKFTDEQFQKIVESSNSISEIASSLGYKSKGGGVVQMIKDRIEKLSLDTSHFNPYSVGAIKGKRYTSDDEIFVENSTYVNNTSLKKKLLKMNVMEYKCAICGISEWLGNPLSLQLDHINGDNRDNRLENLRLLCPNCHSQTSTFSGRNASHN